MDIILNSEEKLRVRTSLKGEIFTDIKSSPDESFLIATFPYWLRLQLRKRGDNIKMFISQPDETIDLGIWSDSEIIWQNF